MTLTMFCVSPSLVRLHFFCCSCSPLPRVAAAASHRDMGLGVATQEDTLGNRRYRMYPDTEPEVLPVKMLDYQPPSSAADGAQSGFIPPSSSSSLLAKFLPIFVFLAIMLFFSTVILCVCVLVRFVCLFA